MNNYLVKQIDNKLAYPFLLEIHYAKRIPSISYCFGLYEFDILVGVVCYGVPAGAKQRDGIAGEDYSDIIFELNRLCLLNNKPNEASFLVSKSLKMLPENLIIISYADEEYGHIGYVYQACNFKYYGLTAKRSDWALKTKPNVHSQTIVDLSLGRQDRKKYMQNTYGEDFYQKVRSRKHRYIYVTGRNKKWYNRIRYTQKPYPKRK